MPVNFSDTVLNSCMDTFAVTFMVYPYASQPLAFPYMGRGIWKVKPVIIETNTGYHSTTQPTMGIRAIEFPFPPSQGDKITIDSEMANVAGIKAYGPWNFIIADTQPDGQGKIDLVLKDSAGGKNEPARHYDN